MKNHFLTIYKKSNSTIMSSIAFLLIAVLVTVPFVYVRTEISEIRIMSFITTPIGLEQIRDVIELTYNLFIQGASNDNSKN